MSKDGNGLAVRQHEREDILLPVQLHVEESNGDQVVFTATSAAPGMREARADLVDVSPGGMGVLSRQYLPRMCAVCVRIATTDGELVFEQKARVRRVAMESHDPYYSIGMAFVDPPPDIGTQVDRVIKLAGRAA